MHIRAADSLRSQAALTADGVGTVVIAITGIHGNFYSNQFCYNIGDTLSTGGVDFIYGGTSDAFGKDEWRDRQRKGLRPRDGSAWRRPKTFAVLLHGLGSVIAAVNLDQSGFMSVLTPFRTKNSCGDDTPAVYHNTVRVESENPRLKLSCRYGGFLRLSAKIPIR